MSTTIEPPPPELAPSETQAEAPMIARLCGALGLFVLTAGVVSVIAAQYGRGIAGEPAGYLFACIGVFLLLLHAARDSDVEVRRLYGGLAVLLLLGAIGVSLYPHKPAGIAEGRVGSLMLPYGGALGLLSLLFFLPFTRHETDESLRLITAWILLGVGVLLTAGSVVAGIFWPQFLLGPGAVTAVLGLGFFAAFFNQTSPTGPTTRIGQNWETILLVVGAVLGGIGVIALLYAAGRAIVPSILHEGPNALKTAAREYDPWKITARAVSILIGLAIASIAVSRQAPLWLRGVAGVLGLTVVGCFVTASISAPIHTQPAPYLVPNGIVLGLVGIVYLVVALGVCSDSQLIVLTRRELSSYFYSPIAYIVLICMVLFASLGYWLFLDQLGVGDSLSEPVGEPILGQYMSFGILGAFQAVFLVPALTMRLFSEEKRTGTLEVLLTAPVADAYVVLSKFAAAWLFFMFCWIPAGIYLIALRSAGEPFDYRPLLSFYLALGCCGAAFIGMGIFFSSLSSNQLIAAVATFAGMMIQLLTVLAPRFKVVAEGLRAAASKVDFLSLWQHALAGQLSVTSILVQLSLAVFWLVLTVKVLEARKWN